MAVLSTAIPVSNGITISHLSHRICQVQGHSLVSPLRDCVWEHSTINLVYTTCLSLNLLSQQRALAGRPLLGVEQPPDCLQDLSWLKLQQTAACIRSWARQASLAASGDQQYSRGRMARPSGEQGQGSQHVPRPPRHNQQPGKCAVGVAVCLPVKCAFTWMHPKCSCVAPIPYLP